MYPGPVSTYGGGAATRAGVAGSVARRGGGGMNLLRGAGVAAGAGLIYSGSQAGSVGSSLVQGALGGAAAGALIGSAVPVIGTAIGATAGAVIGAVVSVSARAAMDDNEQAKRNADKFNMNHRSAEYRENKSMIQWG